MCLRVRFRTDASEEGLRPPSPGLLSGSSRDVGGSPGNRPVLGRWPSLRAASAFRPETKTTKTLVWSQNDEQTDRSGPCRRWAGLMSHTVADQQREYQITWHQFSFRACFLDTLASLTSKSGHFHVAQEQTDGQTDGPGSTPTTSTPTHTWTLFIS